MAGLVPAIARGILPLQMAGTTPTMTVTAGFIQSGSDSGRCELTRNQTVVSCLVIPAQAGTQGGAARAISKDWVPACAGMTTVPLVRGDTTSVSSRAGRPTAGVELAMTDDPPYRSLPAIRLGAIGGDGYLHRAAGRICDRLLVTPAQPVRDRRRHQVVVRRLAVPSPRATASPRGSSVRAPSPPDRHGPRPAPPRPATVR